MNCPTIDRVMGSRNEEVACPFFPIIKEGVDRQQDFDFDGISSDSQK